MDLDAVDGPVCDKVIEINRRNSGFLGAFARRCDERLPILVFAPGANNPHRNSPRRTRELAIALYTFAPVAARGR